MTSMDAWNNLFDEATKMANAQDALIKDLEKKNEEKKSLIEELEERNKRSIDKNYRLINECVNLEEKIKKLDEELAKEKENKEFEKIYIKGLEEVNDRLMQKNLELKEKGGIYQTSKNIIDNEDGAFFEEAYNSGFISNMWKTIESKEKSIQALMDQLDAKDREIEKYKFMVIHMADDLYGKGDLDRGEEDLEDDGDA